MILYHVTPGWNVRSIMRHGIWIAGATTLRQQIWLCDRKRLAWALLHVSEHHECRIVDMAAFRCVITRTLYLYKRREGVYSYALDVPAADLTLYLVAAKRSRTWRTK